MVRGLSDGLPVTQESNQGEYVMCKQCCNRCKDIRDPASYFHRISLLEPRTA